MAGRIRLGEWAFEASVVVGSMTRSRGRLGFFVWRQTVGNLLDLPDVVVHQSTGSTASEMSLHAHGPPRLDADLAPPVLPLRGGIHLWSVTPPLAM